MRGRVAEKRDADSQKHGRDLWNMHEGALIQYAPPAPVFPVSDGDEGLEVRSLQTVLQQLLGRVDVLRDALHTLVQHPRALADLALRREPGGCVCVWGGQAGKK